MAQQTNINGVRYSFVDLSVKGNTAQEFGSTTFEFPKGVISSISWDATQDAGIVQGNQITIVGRTSGYATATGSMELLVSECDDWFSEITNQGQYPVMSVFFDLRISYLVNGGNDTRTDRLQGIKITKVSGANTKGNDATTRTLELSIARVIENNIALFADPAQ